MPQQRHDRPEITIERCTRPDLDGWVELRRALWPNDAKAQHRLEASAMLERLEDRAAFVAKDGDGAVLGFAEAALRQDHVNGCETSPVGFLEGIYVVPAWRRRGLSRLLCQAAEDWAVDLGCSEFASDADAGNTPSHLMHAALGFEETERVVYFRKRLRPG